MSFEQLSFLIALALELKSRLYRKDSYPFNSRLELVPFSGSFIVILSIRSCSRYAPQDYTTDAVAPF